MMRDKIFKKYHRQLEAVGKIHLPEQYPTFGVSVAPEWKYVKDPQGLGIWYTDGPHLYFAEFENRMRMPMISVTTIIHSYSKPFDEKRISLSCARKDDYEARCLDKTDWEYLSISERQERILQAWKTNNREATDYGTYGHAIMEGVTIDPYRSVENAYTEQSIRYGQDKSYLLELAAQYQQEFLLPLLQDGWTVIAEPLIYDLNAFLAGQSDVVAVHHQKKLIRILDFKTNRVRPDLEKSYGGMLGPLTHLPDTSFSHYGIQLTTYQRMVQNLFPDYKLDLNVLLWLDREAVEIVPVYIDSDQFSVEVDYLLKEMGTIREELFKLYQVERYTNFKLQVA